MKLSIFNLHRRAPDSAEGHPTANGAAQAAFLMARNNRPGVQASLFARQLLKTLLLSSSSLGTLLYLLNLSGMLKNEQGYGIAIFGLICLGLLILTGGALARENAPSPKYGFLAAGYLILLYIAGVGMLLTDGWYGNGRVLLVILPLLAAFLFGGGSLSGIIRLATLIFSIAAVAAIGLFVGYGRDPLIQPLPDTSGLLYWLMMVGGFSLVGLVCALALNAYLRVVETSLNKSERIAQGFGQEQQRLENQLQQRANDLERRLLQIRSAAEIIKSMRIISPDGSAAGDGGDGGDGGDESAAARESGLAALLQRVCDLVKERFNLNYVGVFLIEPSASGPGSAVLTAGTGQAGKKLLAEGYRLQVGDDSAVGWVTANRQPRLARVRQTPDVQTEMPVTEMDAPVGDAVADHLGQTRAELALPVLIQQAVIGAITIHSEREDAFDQDDILVLQGIADALANAIENERLFAQTQADLAEIQALHQQYLRRAWDQYLKSQPADELGYQYQANRPAESQDLSQIKTLELPIRLRGMPIGSLNLGIAAERAITAEEAAFINAVIDQAALALENARLLEETRQRAEQEKMVGGIASKVWASTDMDTILRTAVKELGIALDASEAVIELWPE